MLFIYLSLLFIVIQSYDWFRFGNKTFYAALMHMVQLFGICIKRFWSFILPIFNAGFLCMPVQSEAHLNEKRIFQVCLRHPNQTVFSPWDLCTFSRSTNTQCNSLCSFLYFLLGFSMQIWFSPGMNS